MGIFYCHSLVDGRHAYGVVASIVTKAPQVPQTQYAPRQFFCMNPNHQELLSQEIKNLPFTEDLKNLLAANNLKTLQDILNIEIYNWHKQLPGFTMHYQHEIVSYLRQNDLTEYLKEE